jgi:Ca-activated chloride channel family protein
MSFVWPEALFLLLTVPALAAWYVWLLHRRKKHALRYPSLALLRAATGSTSRIRPHIPPLLLLLALAALCLAIARPRAAITLPSMQRTIILAIDTSLSMRADDVQPTRIAAAREAAKAFVAEQPADVRIGIVTFASSASLVQPPTRDRDELVATIDRLVLQVHTAIGSGMILSLATLFPKDGLELEAETYAPAPAHEKAQGVPIDRPRSAKSKEETRAVAPGSFRSGAIILLTDGRRTIGPDPLDAARLAAERGVKVYTVGFGNPDGGTANVDGMPIYMRFDEEVLKAIAEITAAEYFRASSAVDLKKVYQSLNARYVLEKEPTEITALVCAVAVVLTLAAAALSTAWSSRIG